MLSDMSPVCVFVCMCLCMHVVMPGCGGLRHHVVNRHMVNNKGWLVAVD